MTNIAIKINPQGYVFYYIGSTDIKHYLYGTEVIYYPLTRTYEFTSYYSEDISKALHYLDWYQALINIRNANLEYSNRLPGIVSEANEFITVVGYRTDTIGATPWTVSMGRHEIHTNLREGSMYWVNGGVYGDHVTYENLAQCHKPITPYRWAFEQGKKFERGVDGYAILGLYPLDSSTPSNTYTSPSTPRLDQCELQDLIDIFKLGTLCKENTPYRLVEWTEEGPMLNAWEPEDYYKDNNAPI